MKRLLSLIILLLCCTWGLSAQTRVSGTVSDARTGEPIPYVSVVFPDSRIGAMSDTEGRFSIEAPGSYDRLQFVMLGYETCTIEVRPGAATRDASVRMNPDAYGIRSAVVRPKRRREPYRRRGNPAVELIENVIRHKAENHVRSSEGYRVSDYEKLTLALDDFDADFDSSRFWRKLAFLEKYVDTTQFGTPVLTVSLRERLIDTWYQRNPRRSRSRVEGRRSLGLDQPLEHGGLGTNIQAIFTDSDIFDDNMEVLLNRFVSPLSSTLATAYYKYYIADTLTVDGVPCIDLTFVPFNSESFGFTGHLYIVNDSTYAVKKYSLGIPARINLNFVGSLTVEENFERQPNGCWASAEKHTHARFYLFNWMRQLYAHKQVVHSGYDFTQTAIPDSLLQRGDEAATVRGRRRSHEWWNPRRPIPLSDKERVLDSLLTDIYSVPGLRRLASVAESLASEYFPTVPIDRQTGPQDRMKSRFDIGPVTNMLHYNAQEGLRLRLGGMTTARLDARNFLNGYAAYGFRDRRFKGSLSYIHSFTPKELHPFEPLRNTLQLTACYDLEAPGQSFELLDRDNLLMSTTRPQALQYVARLQLRYDREWLSRLSVHGDLRFDRVTPAGTLSYLRCGTDGATVPVTRFDDYSFTARLRYAPGEPLFSNRLGKEAPISLAKDAPVLILSHTTGWFDRQFFYNKTEFSAQKRIWLSSFGHIDAAAAAGGVWNRVPLPKLFSPDANPSLLLLGDAYNLMRPMEFVMDRYAEVFATYYLKGWILNRIPLVRLLRLREVVSFRAVAGTLSERNDPLSGATGLYAFPAGTRTLDRTPYMEYSVGLENIFRFLRVDYVRRISYTEGLEAAQKWGIKFSFRFSI